ncbi:MAG: hypothetical protein QMC67_11440 [Candidatus Wallbacteria bacterium]
MNAKKVLMTVIFSACLISGVTQFSFGSAYATEEIKTESNKQTIEKKTDEVKTEAKADGLEKPTAAASGEKNNSGTPAVPEKSETTGKSDNNSNAAKLPSGADAPAQAQKNESTDKAGGTEPSEKSTVKNYVNEKITKDTNDRIKNELKRLQSAIVSAAQGYNKAEHENSVKTLIYSIAEAVIDRFISSDEETDLAENLSTVIVALKIDKYEAKRVYRQFTKVLEEGDISNSVANKINDNSEKIVDIIRNKKEKTAEADGLVYKYYGLDGNGPKGVREKNARELKVKGYDTFFGSDNQKNSGATEDILKKYMSGEQSNGKKKKKIIGIELMSPNAAAPDKTIETSVNEPDNNASIPPREDNQTPNKKGDKGSKDNSLDELFPDSKNAK